ncbi:hypothetical protein CC2G_009340 [Coprinopsis cinerea AmutBmut pab1-1]|nr:hypothetical protein CC2G_009340 [Coprinopsis cinerea AmutBmut pab1-1]
MAERLDPRAPERGFLPRQVEEREEYAIQPAAPALSQTLRPQSTLFTTSPSLLDKYLNINSPTRTRYLSTADGLIQATTHIAKFAPRQDAVQELGEEIDTSTRKKNPQAGEGKMFLIRSPPPRWFKGRFVIRIISDSYNDRDHSWKALGINTLHTMTYLLHPWGF